MRGARPSATVVIVATIAVACGHTDDLVLGTTEQPVTGVPNSFTFPTTTVGNTSSTTFTVRSSTNMGNSQTDTVMSIAKAASCSGDFAVQATGLPATVTYMCTSFDGSGDCTGSTAMNYMFTASFTPSAGGTQNCVVNLMIDNAASTLSLTGPGQEPPIRFTLNTKAIAFGDVRNVDTSSSQPVVVTNHGTSAATVQSAALADPDGVFVLGGTTGTHSLAGNNTTDSFPVQCAKPAMGDHTGTLTITSNAPSSPDVVNLTCTGIVSNLVFDDAQGDQIAPITLTGTQPDGSTRVGDTLDFPVTLANTGVASVTVHSVSAAGSDVAVIGGAGGDVSIAGGSGMTVTVEYTPKAATTGMIAVGTLNADTDSGPRSVGINGLADQAVIQVSPDGTVDLGPVCMNATSAPTHFTVSNVPAATFAVTVGQPGAPFSLANAPPPATTVDTADALTVGFDAVVKPSGVGTTASAFTITNDIPLGAPTSDTVTLVATGIPAGVRATPTVIDFGAGQVGELSPSTTPIELTNCGSGALTITGTQLIGNADDFAVMSPSSSTLALGDSASFTVTMTPTHDGLRSATLVISFDSGQQMIALVGAGTGGPPDATGSATYYTCNAGGSGGLAVGAVAFGLVVRRRRRRR